MNSLAQIVLSVFLGLGLVLFAVSKLDVTLTFPPKSGPMIIQVGQGHD